MLSAILVAAGLAATPPGACLPEPRLTVAVIAEHHPPAVRSSYSLDELRAFAARSGRSLRHAPLGFYIGTFGYTVEVQASDAGQPGCRPDLAVVVRMMLADRLVELGEDLPCRRGAVLSHYLLHAAQDERLLSLYADRVWTALDRASMQGSLGGAGGGDTTDAVAEVVRRIVDEQLRPYNEERTQALVAVDTDEEVAKLGRACRRDL